MIKRIVRMSFREEETDSFEAIFQASKDRIRAFEGCLYLSLHKDHHFPTVYYTLSHWKDQASLENYRKSALFESTWERTKALFNEKPLAFSLEQLEELP